MPDRALALLRDPYRVIANRFRPERFRKSDGSAFNFIRRVAAATASIIAAPVNGS